MLMSSQAPRRALARPLHVRTGASLFPLQIEWRLPQGPEAPAVGTCSGTIRRGETATTWLGGSAAMAGRGGLRGRKKRAYLCGGPKANRQGIMLRWENSIQEP